jgi:hypothetical protein
MVVFVDERDKPDAIRARLPASALAVFKTGDKTGLTRADALGSEDLATYLP